ncbi:MarR family winged helix-turn-helix transcriptional regulator [Yoonia sediminilitoris]|uniref:MarR family transcriptional regulator n=1 Tax=Yoonia sediminilitoris TaxID=1286148 RepID=A0A2T6KR04_9RHOB|nr:MarR family transcriptional regulator [Yoonia sediminilitoris]PUB18984.1 MarR family transcriptional regulator [Yoonia sediminilitoris]RCW99152.1 MarR family transcriptional regulator [Yoonia sediminilitoris]
MAKPTRARLPTSEPLKMAPELEELIGYNLKRAYVVVQKDYRAALGDGGLSPRTFAALSLAVAYPNLTQSNLARMLGIERSGLVAIIDELERDGLLKRTTVPGDRRVQALVPLEAGIAAHRATLAKVKAHEDKLLEDLSDVEKETLIFLLRKIRRHETES